MESAVDTGRCHPKISHFNINIDIYRNLSKWKFCSTANLKKHRGVFTNSSDAVTYNVLMGKCGFLGFFVVIV